MKVIHCDPRGTYDADMCPVCGDTDTYTTSYFCDGDHMTDEKRCACCGTEYTVTWKLSTIWIEKEGVVN